MTTPEIKKLAKMNIRLTEAQTETLIRNQQLILDAIEAAEKASFDLAAMLLPADSVDLDAEGHAIRFRIDDNLVMPLLTRDQLARLQRLLNA